MKTIKQIEEEIEEIRDNLKHGIEDAKTNPLQKIPNQVMVQSIQSEEAVLEQTKEILDLVEELSEERLPNPNIHGGYEEINKKNQLEVLKELEVLISGGQSK